MRNILVKLYEIRTSMWFKMRCCLKKIFTEGQTDDGQNRSQYLTLSLLHRLAQKEHNIPNKQNYEKGLYLLSF